MGRTVNRAEVLGRVGADPGLRRTGAGAPVTTLRVATERRTGGDEVEVDWHTVVCWGRTAEAVCRHVARGDRVFASGRLAYRSYETADGQRRTAAEICAAEVVFLGGAASRPGPAGAPASDAVPAPF